MLCTRYINRVYAALLGNLASFECVFCAGFVFPINNAHGTAKAVSEIS